MLFRPGIVGSRERCATKYVFVCPVGAPSRKKKTYTPGIFAPGCFLLWKDHLPTTENVPGGVIFHQNCMIQAVSAYAPPGGRSQKKLP